ncbi:hypothetical protein F4818DRAFT_161633 [Hypoxylon cercidicola]|nr:hypothetical protein F4818DRAFT_161633 [Hypoxylon cercidicola]
MLGDPYLGQYNTYIPHAYIGSLVRCSSTHYHLAYLAIPTILLYGPASRVDSGNRFDGLSRRLRPPRSHLDPALHKPSLLLLLLLLLVHLSQVPHHRHVSHLLSTRTLISPPILFSFFDRRDTSCISFLLIILFSALPASLISDSPTRHRSYTLFTFSVASLLLLSRPRARTIVGHNSFLSETF